MRALLAAVLMLAGAAWANCTPIYYGAIAADVLTTRYALNVGATEANPLYGSDPSDGALLAGAAARIAAGWYLDRAGYTWANCILATLTWGVAGNNYAVANGTSRPAGVMIGVSIPLIWHGAQ